MLKLPRLTPRQESQPVLPALLGVLCRDLLANFRRRQELFNPLIFFVMVVALFPLGVSPEVEFLRQSGAGILWVAALLSTLLSLDHLFRHDFDEGVLEQMLLQPQPLYLMVLVKVFSHWLVTGLPLVLMTPVLGVMLHLDGNSIGYLCLTLLVGTPVLSFIGAIGAALTLGLRSAGILLSLLIIPLYIPVLIFGTGTVTAVAAGLPVGSYIALLGALLVVAITCAPFATAAALRISVSNS